MRKTVLALIALMMLGAFVLPVMAQEEEVRLDLDFRGESLDQILQLFRRGYALEYTLGEGVDPNTQITTHLRGVTLDQALRSILEPNGLLAIEQNGRYVVKERPTPTERTEPASRTVTPVFTTESRTPPAPTRQARAYEPRRGAAEEEEGEEEERDEVMEIIYPMYLGADMASAIFGGGFVEAGGYYGGGSGGSSSSYGGSSSNNSSFGGNRSNSSSSFGSNRSNSSSNFGSNRSSSSNRNSGY